MLMMSLCWTLRPVSDVSSDRFLELVLTSKVCDFFFFFNMAQWKVAYFYSGCQML